ncbi:MAG: S41 family peptidase [Chloroflexota bacterium]
MNHSQSPARPYFRTPAISPDGQRIAFVYAADVWLVDIGGGNAERLTAHPAAHSSPRWSPDGKSLAFTSNRTGQGDIYVLPLYGGDVRRITFHDAASNVEAWTPDGTAIYFSSLRDQQGSAIFRVAADGGTPIKWIDQPYEQLNSLSVSPDSTRLAFNLGRANWWRRGPNPYGGTEIWTVSSDIDATDFHKESEEYIGLNRWPLWAADGSGLYFVSDRDGVENMWFQSFEDGQARQITSFTEGRLLWPKIANEQQLIVFERDFQLWQLDLASGNSAPIDIQVRQDTKITPVRTQTYSRQLSELALAPDGSKVAFVVRGEIFADFADKETEKERRQGPSIRVTNTTFREHDIDWSPDSRKLIYTSDRHGDEEIYLYEFTSRTETRLTERDGAKSSPQFSPDGKWVAYACGLNEIRLIHMETRDDRAFVQADFFYGATFAWSPDSRWLVYSAQDVNFLSNLFVRHIDEEQSHQITFMGNLHTSRPIWSSDGQFIIFTTGQYRAEAQIGRVDLQPPQPVFREYDFEQLFVSEEEKKNANTENGEKSSTNGNQTNGKETTESTKAPPDVSITFEGIERRLRLLTPIQMDASAHCISPDSRDLILSAVVAGESNLWALPLDEPREGQSPRRMTGGSSAKGSTQFAPDGKSFYYLDGGQIVNLKFPRGDRTSVPVSGEVVIDFHQEKMQMFDEGWRLLRDYFYDPTFRGLDWSAAREQFAPLVAGAQTHGDFLAILNLMVGELRASHMGAFPTSFFPIEHGYIGLEFDRHELATNGRFRISDIIPESPAALTRDSDGNTIQVGQYLLSVDGVALNSDINLDTLFQRMVDRRVQLRIGTEPTTSEAALEFAVRPVSVGAYDTLRYRAWVQANEAYVHRVSNGRLGYVHIRAMSYAAYQQFLTDLDVEIYGKEGVVVDARFNGGGHTATFILDVLTRRSVLQSTFRDQQTAYADHVAGNRILNKPTILVINESSGSNTEMFAEGYRRLGLGVVVGRPSAGAVIWTFEHQLLDGTRFRLPRIKVATPEGDDLEGTGRAVDIDVALPLGATTLNNDTQLDAAVARLIQQIDEPQTA